MMRRLGAALAAAIIAYAAMADVTGIITPVGGGLPAQTGNSGKFLTTNGSTASWATVAGGGGAFSALTSGTNTAAAMLVGSGASLGATGSGTIAATSAPVSGVSGLGTNVAAFLATPSSANLAAALTGATGTGANVFATSPTLVTPILGTPTSVTLTNATGLPLSTGVTGTLGLTNLDQTIAPTWTGLHTHAPTMTANTSNSGVRLYTSQTASSGNQFFSPGLEWDAQGWATTPVASQPIACRADLQSVQGATNPSGNWTLACSVNGGAYSSIMTLPIVPSTGSGTIFQAMNFNNVRVQGATVPTNGIYNPTTNVLGFATNGTARGSIGAKGELTLTNGILDTGTKFTAAGTGCTIATTVGGATTGTFTLATGPCTSVVITMAGATGITAANGWTCQAHDRTAPTVLIGGESASTTTTATFTIPAGAGTADVISFHCDGF